MHLAALPPIYVSGTSRTNFGNNRTGSDRMSTGCPPGILHTILPLQPEALPAEPIPILHPHCFSPHSFSLYSSAKACHPLSLFLLPPIFYLLFSLCFLFSSSSSSSSSFIFSIFGVYRRIERARAHCPKHRPIFIFHRSASSVPR